MRFFTVQHLLWLLPPLAILVGVLVVRRWCRGRGVVGVISSANQLAAIGRGCCPDCGDEIVSTGQNFYECACPGTSKREYRRWSVEDYQRLLTRWDGRLAHGDRRSPLRLSSHLLLLLLLVGGPVVAQQLGAALWSAGYTRTLYLSASFPHVPTTGPFNPNAVLGPDRYGPAIDWHFSIGTFVGERASCETVEAYVRAGRLPSLDAATYRCTPFDLGDVRLCTQNGRTTANDDMLALVGLPPPVVVPPVDPPPIPPSPSACVAPRQCIEPVTCPPPVTCPDPPPVVACVEAVPIALDVMETLRLAPSWIPTARPQQRRRVQAAYESLRTLRCQRP